VSVDTINELTSASGVTADGVLLKDAAVTATGGVTTPTISEAASGSGVTVDGVLLKDSNVNASGVTAETVTATGNMVTDTILERTSAAGVTIDGVLLKDGGITATGANTITLGTITADAIDETTPGSGVTVDGLLIKDGEARWIMPSGIVAPYAGASAPSGWLLCDGAAVSRTTYAALFAVLSTTFGVGDGSTTFNVPDMRETAPVGVGTRGAGVTAHDTYTLGQFKDDQMQGHKHVAPTYGTGANAANVASVTDSFFNTNETGVPITDGTNGTPRTGTTTHGKQIGLNYIIKT